MNARVLVVVKVYSRVNFYGSFDASNGPGPFLPHNNQSVHRIFVSLSLALAQRSKALFDVLVAAAVRGTMTALTRSSDPFLSSSSTVPFTFPVSGVGFQYWVLDVPLFSPVSSM